MDFLDTDTVLKVSAVFNLMAALAWLALAQLFRIAPRASRLMALAHFVRIGTHSCSDCLAGWPGAVRQSLPATGLLVTLLLLVLALRRMMRTRQRPQDLAVLGVLGAAGLLAGLATGSTWLIQFSAAGCGFMLGLLAIRDIVRGVGQQLSRPITFGLAMPFVMLAAFSGLHVLGLTVGPGWNNPAGPGGMTPVTRAVLGLVTSVSISLSLLALMIWRLIAHIQHLTTRDPLTGALNRRAFEQTLAEAQAQLLRGRGYALMMIDIDHFKRINDAHGHPAGDAALRHCVRIWQGGLRPMDRLGRIGGEEFAAMLPLATPTDLDAAEAVAERLRSQLQASPLHWKGIELPLTASFGVSLPVVGDATGEVALARADAELYRAKAEGRNRVCVASHLLAQPAA